MQFKLVSTRKAFSHILAHTLRLKDIVIRKGNILNKEHISLIKEMRKDGFSYKNIALKLNDEGISITRPTVQAKLKPFNL